MNKGYKIQWNSKIIFKCHFLILNIENKIRN